MNAGNNSYEQFLFYKCEKLSTLFSVFVVLGLELRDFTLSHSTSPIFVMGFFSDRVSRTICLGWLQTEPLLISAS
jgi:hypothetical protein